MLNTTAIEELARLLKSRQRIEAIKLVREALAAHGIGVGLKAASDFIGALTEIVPVTTCVLRCAKCNLYLGRVVDGHSVTAYCTNCGTNLREYRPFVS